MLLASLVIEVDCGVCKGRMGEQERVIEGERKSQGYMMGVRIRGKKGGGGGVRRSREKRTGGWGRAREKKK